LDPAHVPRTRRRRRLGGDDCRRSGWFLSHGRSGPGRRPAQLYKRRRSRVQARTAPSSSPKPQAEAPPAPGSPAGERLREHHRAGLPRTPGLLRLPAATASPCTRRLPAMRLPRTSRRPAPPGCAVTTPDQPRQTQTHPIGPGQHENDHDTRAAQAAPSPGSAEMRASSN